MVPNDAHDEVLNVVGGTIALVERGRVPFATKVRNAQDVRAPRVLRAHAESACSCTLHCFRPVGSCRLAPVP